MADLDIARAVHKITSFGRKSSPAVEEPVSTQYSGGLDDSEIIRSELELTSTQGVRTSTDPHTAAPIGASSFDQSTLDRVSGSAPATDPSPIAPLPTLFAIMRAADESPSKGFAFEKPKKQAINTVRARGAVAIIHGQDEQPVSESIGSATVDPSSLSTTVNIPATSQPDQLSKHCKSGDLAYDPYANPGPRKANPGFSEHSNQAILETEPSARNKRQGSPASAQCYIPSSGPPAGERISPTVSAGDDGADNCRHGTGASTPASLGIDENCSVEENMAVLDQPTLINEDPASPSIRQASSKSSSQFPVKGRSARITRGVSNDHSTGHESPGCSSFSRPWTAGKVVKHRPNRRTRWSALQEDQSNPLSRGLSADSEGQLLKALTIRYRHQQHERHQLKAKLLDKNLEIQDLQIITKNLDQQLAANERCVASQDAELSKYRHLMPRWQDRVKKLSDYVKGLSNDHRRLRNEARSMQVEQQDLRSHKDTMDTFLRDMVGAVEHERTKHKDRLLKAHNQTELIQQALNTRNLDLLGETQRLRVEQGRTASLQESLATFASDNGKILERLADQDITTASQITELGKIITDFVDNASSLGQADLIPKLEECLSLLKRPQVDHSTGADDVQKLDMSIKENADRIARLASVCQDTLNATSNLETRLSAELSARVQELFTSIEAGHSMDQQLKAMEGTSATITERLRATDEWLSDSRNKLTAAETQEKIQLQKIAGLEGEVNALRNRPQESPLFALRLHDSEKQCVKQRDQLSMMQLQLDSAKGDLEAKSAENSRLGEVLQATETQFVEAQSRFKELTLEKIAMEGQAKLNEDGLRAELSQAMKKEISRCTRKSENEMQELRSRASTAEKALVTAKALETEKAIETEKTLVAQLRAEKSRADTDIETKMGSIVQLQAEKAQALEDVDKIAATLKNLKASAEDAWKELGRMIQVEQDLLHKNDEKEKELREIGAELRKLHESRSHRNDTVKDLRFRLREAEADNTELQRCCRSSEDLLANANQKSKSQEHRIAELSKDHTAKAQSESTLSENLVRTHNPNLGKKAVAFENPIDGNVHQPHSSPSDSSGPRRSKKDVYVVEDSQDRGAVVEDTQDQLPVPQRRQGEPSVPDQSFISDPLSYMPKGVQDMMAEPSSPPSNPQPESSPVTDGRQMFPPSPAIETSGRGRILEDSQAAVLPSQEHGISRENPSQHTYWAVSTSTTKTKSHSVERSVSRRSQSVADPASLTRSDGKNHSQASTSKHLTTEPSHQTHGILKNSGLKRVMPESQSQTSASESQDKRQKLSSETEKQGLGPKLSSPANPTGTSRRKSTLRRTQQGDDKYHSRFLQELQKPRR